MSIKGYLPLHSGFVLFLLFYSIIQLPRVIFYKHRLTLNLTMPHYSLKRELDTVSDETRYVVEHYLPTTGKRQILPPLHPPRLPTM